MSVVSPVVRELDNGLTVVMDPVRGGPRISARVVARWGAGDDPRDATGAAHLLEHLLANKGTRRLGTTDPVAEAALRSRVANLYRERAAGASVEAELDAAEIAASRLAIPNELKSVWSALGGRGFNASTSHDRTSYRVEVPLHRLDAWAMLETDRFSEPAFRGFGPEVSTVLEEIARSGDDPNRSTWAQMREALFAGHPYAEPVLGSAEHVSSATPAASEAFFGAGYGARNLVACLSGDFDPEQVLSVLTGTLGTIPPGNPRAGWLGSPAELSRDVHVSFEHEAEPEVRLAWRTVGAGHADHAALTLADLLLSNAAGGLLRTGLVHPHKVRAAGSVRLTLREAGALVLWARPLGGQSDQDVIALLEETVEHLQAGRFSAEQMRSVLLNTKVAEQRRLENSEHRASRLVRAVAWNRPLHDVWDWSDELSAVSPEDVVRVAKQYLCGPRVTLSRSRGTPAEATRVRGAAIERPMARGSRSGFARSILEAPSVAPEPQTLTRGVDYVVRSMPWGDSIEAAGPTPGLGRLVLRLELGSRRTPLLPFVTYWVAQGGLGERNRSDFQAGLYRRAVSWDVGVGRHATDLVVDGPLESLRFGLEQVVARLNEPRHDVDDSRRLLNELVARRREARGSRDVVGSALDRLVLRGELSEFLAAAPSDDEIIDIHASGRRDLISRLLAAPACTLATGIDEPFGYVSALLEQPTLSAEAEQTTYVRPGADRVLVSQFAASQTRVALLCPSPPMGEDAEPYRRVLDEIVGGSGGLLFQEIRESRGLAYATSGRCGRGATPADDEVLWAVTMCDAKRAGLVARLMVSLVRDVEKLTVRFEAARAALVARDETHRIRPSRVAGTVAGWRRFGYTADPRPARRVALDAATVDGFRAYIERWGRQHVSVTVLGDLAQVDRNSLQEIGQLSEVSMSDLFSY